MFPPEKENLPNHEIVRHGRLADFLRQEYLVSAGKPELEPIPDILERLLAPAITKESINKAVITGSVARCLAGKTDERFWQFPAYFASQAASESDPAIKRILKYLACGPQDLDLKIDGDINEFTKNLCHLWQVSYRKGQGSLEAEFDLEGFHIFIKAGEIPTNRSRKGLEIIFSHQDSDYPLFFIHIGELPKLAWDSLTDKRVGETFDKQDFVMAELFSDGKAFHYQLSKQAREVMVGVDRFCPSENLSQKSAGDLAEIGLRSLRVNLLNSQTPEAKIALDSLLPSIGGSSLLEFRRAVFQRIVAGQQIDEATKPIIIRELFLCLTVDPYSTCLFLRDSALSSLIAGLAELNDQGWQQILSSSYLQVALDGVRTVAQGPEYLNTQREFYKKRGVFSGAEMFAMALGWQKDEGHSAWRFLIELFQKEEPKDYYDYLVNNGLSREVRGWLPDEKLIRLLISFMQAFPSGLTAQDLKGLTGPVPDFDKQLFILKLTGAVRRRRLSYLKDQVLETVDFYSLRDLEVVAGQQSLAFLYKDRTFMEILQRIVGNKTQASKCLLAFLRPGITTIQVLGVLTATDFQVMGGIAGIQRDYRQSKKDTYDCCCRRAEQIIQAFREWSDFSTSSPKP